MIPVSVLYFIIFLEGYIVLSTELLAIRLLIPFTGSGTDTVSIIIAAVLLPLSFGYFAGGRFKKRCAKGKARTVRGKLIFNLVLSAVILTFGLSYVFLDGAFDITRKTLGTSNRLVLTTLYAFLFVVIPVYLLGQTVPLISNYFSRDRLSAIAGRILFFSTLGSFAGAIFSTLIFMTLLGVHHTASITIGCMALLVFVLARKKTSGSVLASLACLAITLFLNSNAAMEHLNIVSNNRYSVVQVESDGYGVRKMILNRTSASTIYEGTPEPYMAYNLFIEDNFLASLEGEGEKKSILVLGAGGFTLGRRDEKNDYVYVDIDPTLKAITEEKLLQEKLPPNNKYVAMDARAYLLQTDETYDVIVLDLFRDPVSVHENLNTQEFFTSVRNHLKKGGVMVANYWASPTFSDTYSRNLDFTLRSVFPLLNRQVIDIFDVWKREKDWHNIIYSYVHHTEPLHAYTDMKNTIIYDKPL
ncbi:MAG: fused MFS/spermidine synthase [Alphaproteobacteria bacterium]|nr:fused MFS/spermidine synthase [Alphaproteobacteria bacterium]